MPFVEFILKRFVHFVVQGRDYVLQRPDMSKVVPETTKRRDFRHETTPIGKIRHFTGEIAITQTQHVGRRQSSDIS